MLADSQTRQALLLEPGDEAERLIAALAGFKLTAVWLTHAHFDHIGVLAEVYRQFLVLVYLHEDARKFNHAAASTAFFGLVVEQPVLGTATADSRSDSEFGYTRRVCLRPQLCYRVLRAYQLLVQLLLDVPTACNLELHNLIKCVRKALARVWRCQLLTC